MLVAVTLGRTGDYEKIRSPPSRHARRHLESLVEPKSLTPKSGGESATRGFSSVSEFCPRNFCGRA